MRKPQDKMVTNKSVRKKQASTSGVLRKILIKEGESAPLGQVIAIIGEADEDISVLEKEAESRATSTDQPSEVKPESAAAAAASTQSATPAATETRSSGGQLRQSSPEPVKTAGGNGAQLAPADSSSKERLIVSPLAARMAAEAGVDLRTLSGTGP